ncbi:MAG: Nodulation protein NoeA-related protein [Candidatus Pacebacteria bacterium GW2011_GWB1_47_8]|nr:MAG: Nodulation protein NoeA-related protein [Candidatus Pacebacteria bacterium GW2011_GWA1_46_10]KKU84415.1 MAG: Nodulation protein NoeA-related protein [Candidatus Pacebacteria bacterium GW2011_GWB1_47_8]HCR81154.1 SAM-dependent methyltransferase [Candidatus Paceibacterota bacterium]
MKNRLRKTAEPGSFRDPHGFVYYHKGSVYRQVHPEYATVFSRIEKAGFYQHLIDEGWLISYQKVSKKSAFDHRATLVLKVKPIPFLSYPYEWSFSQLKDAALFTLKLQKLALTHDFSLKDASAYNIQFLEGKPILIDLLSFEEYRVDAPWVAYRQFCEHFLGPLLLTSYTDLRLHKLLRTHLDGLPLDLVSHLLPKKTYLNFAIAMHVHFHARQQQQFGARHHADRHYRLSKLSFMALLDSLESPITKLTAPKQPTEWGEYYTFTNYSPKAFAAKKKIITQYLRQSKPRTVWDLGGNTGEFSHLASNQGIFTVSFDTDPRAVEINYLMVKEKNEKHLLPLLMDLTNPSPDLGWALTERQSLIQRGPAELTMVLALIHHLAISQNVPFEKIANFLARLSRHLIIEFVPKADSQVQKLLATREDIFTDYHQDHFEKAFHHYFRILEKDRLGFGSQRSLYLMKRK